MKLKSSVFFPPFVFIFIQQHSLRSVCRCKRWRCNNFGERHYTDRFHLKFDHKLTECVRVRVHYLCIRLSSILSHTYNGSLSIFTENYYYYYFDFIAIFPISIHTLSVQCHSFRLHLIHIFIFQSITHFRLWCIGTLVLVNERFEHGEKYKTKNRWTICTMHRHSHSHTVTSTLAHWPLR